MTATIVPPQSSGSAATDISACFSCGTRAAAPVGVDVGLYLLWVTSVTCFTIQLALHLQGAPVWVTGCSWSTSPWRWSSCSSPRS